MHEDQAEKVVRCDENLHEMCYRQTAKVVNIEKSHNDWKKLKNEIQFIEQVTSARPIDARIDHIRLDSKFRL